MSHFQSLLLFAVCTVAVALTGCGGDSGPKTVDVTGTVSLDGTPVDEGQIYFRADDGSATCSAPIREGKYDCKVTPGAKTIEIIGYRIVPGKFEEVNPGEKTPVKEMFIPKKFNSKTTLTLSVSEDKDKMEENFTLESKG
ncbi:hypothetical protein [Blastopirellula marina]|uniref:Carboxypeptidase regulatory-like domain-containing protein n=1 Tax=Blastopirellula marina TaxID=124 RepID=A0A2S8GVW2_9BACT|nr:hypothetical protein [Blastopirellula marina]PQO48184.1 hypothetical protein C5Y93_00435 [Blastopirellula marina]